jgi:hypothetical protein
MSDDDDSLMSLDVVIWSSVIVTILGMLSKILP